MIIIRECPTFVLEVNSLFQLLLRIDTLRMEQEEKKASQAALLTTAAENRSEALANSKVGFSRLY